MKNILAVLALIITITANAALGPTTLMTNGSMTGTSKINSNSMDMLNLEGASFQATWTGTPTGAFTVEGSIDGNTYYNIGANGWTDPAGAAGSILISVALPQWRYIRLAYTNASSTGTLTTILGMAK